MPYLAVNKDGTELISNEPLFRATYANDLSIKRFSEDYRMYSERCEGKWADTFSEGHYKVPTFSGVELPQGTILAIIGRSLSWDDEPLQF
jgi:hypothetical protein